MPTPKANVTLVLNDEQQETLIRVLNLLTKEGMKGCAHHLLLAQDLWEVMPSEMKSPLRPLYDFRHSMLPPEYVPSSYR